MTARTALLFLLICFVANGAHAQSGAPAAETAQVYLTNFSPRDYGAVAQNWAVTQDDRGVMYFGNTNGVLEYDGVSWRTIPLSNSINVVRSLDTAADGRVWVGGVGEIGYLAPDSVGQRSYVSLLEHVPEADRDFQSIWTTHATDEGVYFQSYNKLFHWSEGTMRVFSPRVQNGFHRPSFVLGRKFYLRQRGVGLMQMQGDSLSLVPGGARFADEPVLVMLPYDERRILVGTLRQGLWLYDPSAETSASFVAFPTEADAFLREQLLYRPGAVLPDGNFALGTRQGGLVVIDRQGRLVRTVDQAAGLMDEAVWFTYVDRSGALWLALNNGLARVEIASPLTYFDVSFGLEGMVNAIARHQGSLYVGTNIGLFRLDGVTGRFQRVGGMDEEVQAWVWDLLVVDDVLLAGVRGGLFRIDGDQAQLVWRLPETIVAARVLHPSRKDASLLFLGLNPGLAAVRMDASGALLEAVLVPGVDIQVDTIAEDTAGSLWLGSQDGALRVRFPERAGKRVLAEVQVESFGEENGLPPGAVFPNQVGEDVYLVAGWKVYGFDEERRTYVHDTTFEARFPSGHEAGTRFLTTDAQGRIWGNPGGGFAVVRPGPDGGYTSVQTPFRPLAGRAIEAFTIEEGAGAGTVVWFGGADGLIRYDESVPKDFAQPYRALIRRVTAGADSLYFGGGEVASPVLRYADNGLRFEYAAAFYEEEAKTTYQYLLDGFDPGWSPWSTATKKEYTNLSKGDYTFRVKARNLYGLESEAAAFGFTILPPWYRTWWAYGLYGVLFLGGVFAADRVQRRRLIKQERGRAQLRESKLRTEAAESMANYLQSENQRQELEIQKKEELELAYHKLKATQAQLIQAEKMASLGALTAGIAHEIKNPLNFINNFAEVNEELADEAIEGLERGEKNELLAILQDLKQNAQVINQHGKRADSIVHAMMQHASGGTGHRVPTDINALVSEHIDLAYHGKRAQVPGLTLEIERDLGGDVDTVDVVPQEIGRVLLNLLGNAFDAVLAHASQGDAPYAPTVRVSTRRMADGVAIRVSDNGPGIPAEIREKIFEPFFTTKPTGKGTGLGLSLSYDIVTQGHGGTLAVESETGQGATFIVALPQRQSEPVLQG